MGKRFEITHFPDKPSHMLYVCELGNEATVWATYNIKKDKFTLKGFTCVENPITGFVMNAVREYLKDENVLQNGITFKVV